MSHGIITMTFPTEWKNNTCSKPPTRFALRCQGTSHIHPRPARKRSSPRIFTVNICPLFWGGFTWLYTSQNMGKTMEKKKHQQILQHLPFSQTSPWFSHGFPLVFPRAVLHAAPPRLHGDGTSAVQAGGDRQGVRAEASP